MKEPVVAAGVVSGISMAGLRQPLTDILLEMHASDRLARAVVTLVIIAVPFLISLIARTMTVALEKHQTAVTAALEMPEGSSLKDLAGFLAAKKQAEAEPVPTTNPKEI